MTDRQLLYFADPMCSWCWGFSPVIHRIASTWQESSPVIIHVGGLRAGNTEAMSDQQRMYILNHWFNVNETSGQPFDFTFRMPDGFIYDTEPACRAVKVVQKLDPGQALDYFSAIQHAFYTLNLDVTRVDTLSGLARNMNLNTAEFEATFKSGDAQQSTQNDFRLTQQFGVNGFPCLIGQAGDELVYISQGYQRFERVNATIEKWYSS